MGPTSFEQANIVYDKPQLHAAAAAIALIGMGGSMPVLKEQANPKDSTKGIVCGSGWKPKPQPRNKPCGCGSGIKAKKCCGNYPQDPPSNTNREQP